MKCLSLTKHVILWLLLISLIGVFYTAPLWAIPEYWPTNEWRSSTPEEQGMDSKELIEMLELVHDNEYPIDSISIIRNGYLVTDAYFFPFRKNTQHMIFSNTKSIISALIGIAIDKGFIKSVKQPILDFFPEKTIANLNEQKRSITLEHLLTMTSGLDTQDSWLFEWTGLAKMRRSDDWGQYVLDRPMAHEPGTYFDYSNGVSHLLAVILNQTTKMSPFEFAKKHLFGPLNITNVKWPMDRQGIHLGYAQIMLAPHDMAKFGLLYLNEGRWEDQQIISKAWVTESTRKHVDSNTFDGYGYQWWSGSGMYNADVLHRLIWKWGFTWKNSPHYYMAVGHLGQFIYVVPEKNMVVVFTSHQTSDFDFFVSKGLMDEYIIPAAVSLKPLETKPKMKERLDALTKEVGKSPKQGYIWISKNEGQAQNGTLIRKTSPAFLFKYPKTCLKKEIRHDGQVMAMETQAGNLFEIFSSEVPENTSLAEIGPKTIAWIFKEAVGGSDIQVISNREITLTDGTVAYRTDIDWTTPSGLRLRTLSVSAYKDDIWVWFVYTLNHLGDMATPEDIVEGAAIIESLTFGK